MPRRRATRSSRRRGCAPRVRPTAACRARRPAPRRPAAAAASSASAARAMPSRRGGAPPSPAPRGRAAPPWAQPSSSRASQRTLDAGGRATSSRSPCAGTSMSAMPVASAGGDSTIERDRGRRGLVAREQQRVDLAGAPVDADPAAGAQLVGADEHDLVAGCGARRPRRRGTAVTVADEDDVDLARCGTDGAHRVGAERILELDRQLAPRGVPVLAVGEGREADLGQRQHDLHALVEPRRAEVRRARRR